MKKLSRERKSGNMHILILTGGGFDLPFTRSYMNAHKFDLVIAADRGVSYAAKLQIVPDVILGDFDSIDPETKKKMQEWNVPITTFPVEKDYTDTHLALEKAMEMGADEITLIGGTGTRMDHTWANIGLLQMTMKAGIPAWIVDPNNRISMHDKDFSICKKEAFGEYVSFLPFTENVRGLTLEGFYYSLKNTELKQGVSLGISNELTADIGQVKLKDGVLIMIESRD
jgi:thiamine pyrophosphokinase